jgi:hypothetical protein
MFHPIAGTFVMDLCVLTPTLLETEAFDARLTLEGFICRVRVSKLHAFELPVSNVEMRPGNRSSYKADNQNLSILVGAMFVPMD